MRVEWVHPSWRDLVIGRLKNDAQARREFINRSGVYGALLALSTAGGAAGERRLPLIGSDEDWDALTDRLYELIPELEPPELVTVLTAVSETIDDLGRTEAVGEARALARAALSRAATMWDDSSSPIPLVALDAWVALASRVRPRPPLPDLSITWVELLPARAPMLDHHAELGRFADWLSMCRLLWHYGPQLEAELGFGPDHVDLMVTFQREVDHRAWRDAGSFDATALDLVLRALDSIAELEVRLAPRSQEIAGQLVMHAPPIPRSGGAPAQPQSPTETFDVRRVLFDL